MCGRRGGCGHCDDRLGGHGHQRRHCRRLRGFGIRLRLLASDERQCDPKRRPRALMALGADGAAHELHQRLADREPEAGTAVAPVVDESA